MKHCEASNWNSAQVRRWLENEGFREFWHFLEPDAPITGHDILSLTADDWHKLFVDRENEAQARPSVIKVRRLLNLISKLKNLVPNGIIGKSVVLLSDNEESRGEAPFFSDGDPSDEDEISDLRKEKMCRYCHQNPKVKMTPLKPERWKTLLAFLYVLLVSWVTAFVMVIVHDRVPDMEKYPPLPDIILDNVPHIPWAFQMCELTGMILFSLWVLVVLFHKHRFILMRRFFSISGTIFMLRCVTMLITSLSVPGTHLECQPRPYGDLWNKVHNAYIIWTGAGMSLQGVRTCGDYMFSGHTVSLTLLNFFITEYTSRKIYFLHTFTWICNIFGVFFILAAHEHYSIDVFVAFYITSRLFMYYHMLANKNKSQENLVFKSKSYEEHRTWFWFPLFSFFESSIGGTVPNEFDWPISMYDFKEMFKQVQDCVMDLVGKINNKIVSNDAKMDQNSSKKQNGLKKKVKSK